MNNTQGQVHQPFVYFYYIQRRALAYIWLTTVLPLQCSLSLFCTRLNYKKDLWSKIYKYEPKEKQFLHSKSKYILWPFQFLWELILCIFYSLWIFMWSLAFCRQIQLFSIILLLLNEVKTCTRSTSTGKKHVI